MNTGEAGRGVQRKAVIISPGGKTTPQMSGITRSWWDGRGRSFVRWTPVVHACDDVLTVHGPGRQKQKARLPFGNRASIGAQGRDRTDTGVKPTGF